MSIKARIQNKNDTSANWEKATNFVPLAGEFIVYSDLNRFKIGDGSTTVSALPFCPDYDISEIEALIDSKLGVIENGSY